MKKKVLNKKTKNQFKIKHIKAKVNKKSIAFIFAFILTNSKVENPPLETEEKTLQFSSSGPEHPKDPHFVSQI